MQAQNSLGKKQGPGTEGSQGAYPVSSFHLHTHTYQILSRAGNKGHHAVKINI